jgi:predicted hotdog family 3-hydroxylacyl-ACP dehydratase
MMNISNDILEFIPQRRPFVMVDKLLYADEEKATTNFTITSGNILCEDGFFSEAGLMENIAQTIAAGRGYKKEMENKPIAGGYIAAVRNFEIFFLPKINDLLTTEIFVTGTIFNVTNVAGKILLNDSLVAQCEMKIFSNANE